MGENLCQPYSDKGFRIPYQDNKNIQGVEKSKLPKLNDPLRKEQINRAKLFQRKKSKWLKIT
jgi:hypothetical protein